MQKPPEGEADPPNSEVQSTPASPGSKLVKAMIGLGLLVALYYGITGGIRAYVSSQIEGSEGRPMPEFELEDLQGRTWTRSDLLGKTTLLNFFRSRCPNCERERDAIHAMHRDADSAKLQVIGIMTDRVVDFPPDLTARTLDRFGYEHPILMATEAFADAFHGAGWAHVTPVTYIVDAKGVIRQALRGHQNLETLRTATR